MVARDRDFNEYDQNNSEVCRELAGARRGARAGLLDADHILQARSRPIRGAAKMVFLFANT